MLSSALLRRPPWPLNVRSIASRSSPIYSPSSPSLPPAATLSPHHQRYKLTVQYNGGGLHGWSSTGPGHSDEPGRPSVQGLLAEACQELVGAEGTVEVYGSSRTDSGVHATGNVCHVDLLRRHRKTNVVVEPHPADVVQRALNGLLEDKRPQQRPSSAGRQRAGHRVCVVGAETVGDDFHARYSAVERTYMYRLIIPLFDEWGGGGEGAYGEGGTRMPPPLPRIFDDGLAWVVRRPVDVGGMRAAAARLEGEHNFSSVRGSKCSQKGPAVRILDELSVHELPPSASTTSTRGLTPVCDQYRENLSQEIVVVARARSFM